MVGGEEGERVGSYVPGSIMARQKPWGKKKKKKSLASWAGALCDWGIHAAGEVGLDQIRQGLGGHGKEFGFCYLYKGTAILRSVLITLTTSGS